MKISELKSAIREMIISELNEATFEVTPDKIDTVRAKAKEGDVIKIAEDEALMEMAKIVGDLKVAIEKVIDQNKDAEMKDLRKAVQSDADVKAALANDPEGSALQPTQLNNFILKIKGERIPQQRGRKADPNKPAKEPKEPGMRGRPKSANPAAKKKDEKVKTFSMTKKYYSDSEDQEGPSDLELRKLAKSGGKVEKGKAAQLRAQEKAKLVKAFLKDMRDAGIVDNANRILDKEKYADAWSKTKIEIEDKVSKLS
jgi:hypothetical protein